MTGSHDHTAAVLIVGGGITGLSAAYFLARLGVRPHLVERHPSTAIMPQARAFNPRSMEIYRAFGLAGKIHERQSKLSGMPEMMGADTLAGAERFRVDMLAQVRPGPISPTDWAMIDQDELERVVRTHAERAGADVRFGTELVSLDSDIDGVTATVHHRDSDTVSRIRADYLIAADGNRAGIRAQLGVEADGPGILGHAAHFLFDADLDAAVRGRRFLLAYLDRPTPGTVLVPLGHRGRWMLGVPFDAERGESIEDFGERRCVDLARDAVGIADLDLTLVPPVAGWSRLVMDVRIGAMVARRYRAGRVFFAGDSAHVVPPTGSFGASTGIQDAHNLAWKLAAVLRGQAGPQLLDTYEVERRPVARTTMDTALRILHARHRGTGAEATNIDEVAMTFGYRYHSQAVRTEPDASADPVEDPRTPSGSPGLRAPHVWLHHEGRRISTTDLCTGAFTLLVGADGPQWADAARAMTETADVDLDVYRVGADLQDPENQFLTAFGITATGATLVRPDGFVAWRSVSLPPQHGSQLRQVLTQVLARDTESARLIANGPGTTGTDT